MVTLRLTGQKLRTVRWSNFITQRKINMTFTIILLAIMAQKFAFVLTVKIEINTINHLSFRIPSFIRNFTIKI